MTSVEIAWLAGLLEGEGYFHTYGCIAGGRRYRYARITLSMTDRDTIERVGAMWGKAVGQYKNGHGRLPIFKTTVGGVSAIQWMMTVYLLMGARRRARIRECIEEWRALPDSNQRRRIWSRAIAQTRWKAIRESGQTVLQGFKVQER